MIQRPLANMATLTRSTIGQRFNASGDLEAVAIDTIREDYDPVTLAGRGMPVEAPVTELITESAVTTAGWAVVGGASVSFLTLGALGVFPGALVTSGGSVLHMLARRGAGDITVTSGLPYALSLYYRAGTSGRLRVEMLEVVGSTSAILTGAVGALTNVTTTGGTLTVDADELLADGLTRRLRATFTPNTTGAYRLRAGPDSATVGHTVTLLAAFMRQAATHSSPILTTSGTLVRGGDFPSVALGPWFSDAAGTGVIEFIASTPLESGQRVFSIDDGTTPNRIELRIVSGVLRLTMLIANVVVVDLAAGSVTAGTVNRVAFAFSDGDSAVSLNGAASVTSAVVGIPSGFTRFLLGRTGTSGHLNGWISTVVWWAERKPNSYLEAESA